MAVIAELDLANLLPATFTAPDLTEEDFLALCAKFPDATLEYTPEGTILIMPRPILIPLRASVKCFSS